MNATNIQNWRKIDFYDKEKKSVGWVRVVKEEDHFLEFLSSFSSKMSFWTWSSLWMRFLLDSLMKPDTRSSSRMK